MFLTAYHNFHHIPFFFPVAFFCLVIATIVIVRIVTRRYGHSCGHHQDNRYLDAEEILKRRYINHEINEEEYLKMKEVLKK